MRRYFLLFIVLACSVLVHAQFTISYSAGYSSYNTGAMRDFMRNVQIKPPASTIGAKNIDNFPAQNIIHVIDVGYRFDKHEFGLKGGGFLSTGGKLSIKDYSGEYANSFTVNGIRVGVYYKGYFYAFTNDYGDPIFTFFGEVSPGIYVSEFKNQGSFVVHDEELDAFNNKHDASSFSLLLQIGAKYYITRKLTLGVSVGYDAAAKAEVEELTYPASINWSGVRFTGGIGYSF